MPQSVPVVSPASPKGDDAVEAEDPADDVPTDDPAELDVSSDAVEDVSVPVLAAPELLDDGTWEATAEVPLAPVKLPVELVVELAVELAVELPQPRPVAAMAEAKKA